MSGVAAIVLAAGLGTRFGGGKLVAEFRGKPLVRYAAEAAAASRASPVLVVVGHDQTRVRRALAGLAVTFVDNSLHAEGLSTSLKAGFAELPPRADAAIVLLGDMPGVTAGLIDTLIAAWTGSRPEAVIPTYQGRRGNPVLLSRRLEADLRELEGDVGAGPLLRARADVKELAVDDEAVLRDADTPLDLAKLGRLTS